MTEPVAVLVAPGSQVVTPKPWWKSKTLYFNAITTVVGLAGLVPDPIAMGVAGVGNVVLRTWFTEAPIK